jgi:hypothetical protein
MDGGTLRPPARLKDTTLVWRVKTLLAQGEMALL